MKNTSCQEECNFNRSTKGNRLFICNFAFHAKFFPFIVGVKCKFRRLEVVIACIQKGVGGHVKYAYPHFNGQEYVSHYSVDHVDLLATIDFLSQPE